jgi:glycerate kinase
MISSLVISLLFNDHMHIVIAPNAFKNSLSAPDAAEAIRSGLKESGLPFIITSFPIGDGGDGSASLIVKNGNGTLFDTEANDPIGRKIKSSFGVVDEGRTAVIELADISGLKLLSATELDPLHTSTFGTGELIRAALNKGVRKIILCVGGSATVDGGCGIMQALGIRFLDSSNKMLTQLPENLIYLDSIDSSALDQRILNIEFIILCDVNNRLLGEKGAAAVFGPQKGASMKDIVLLETALTRLREITLFQTGKDMNAMRHGGAAGGVAAGLNIFLNATLVQGIEYFLDITGFDEILREADILITGEGSIDLQTLEGKGPFGVARRARERNIPVIAVGGQISQQYIRELKEYFDVLITINQPLENVRSALMHTADNLHIAGSRIAQIIAQQFI